MTGASATRPRTPPAISAAAARQDWLDAALAIGGHLTGCAICQPRQACAEYGRLDAAERTAWAALERAREGRP